MDATRDPADVETDPEDSVDAPAGSSELGSLATELAALAATPAWRRPLRAGVLVDGQYRVERLIGEGAMGAVYLAHDARLGRPVALKVETAVSATALARASREALALARLSHPNVVVVHQVGQLEGRLYIAMEHVAGGNARAWQRARNRSWRELLGLYAAAGDGLVAAHAAGLIHRDFKPDNVLIGEDDRPRVADFGLARGVVEPAGSGDDRPARSAPAEAATVAVSATGAIAGTPAYMAPEQLAGGSLDARADQFAFCVALWEALFDVRPFEAATPLELSASIARGPTITRVHASRRAPRHVIAALLRGLRASRDDRWPSMTALLAELRRDPARRWRWIAVALVALVAGGTVAAVVGGHPGTMIDPCEVAAREIEHAWSPAHADALRAGWRAPHGRAVARTVAALDAWSGRWSASYRAACRSGQAWGPEARQRSLACLERRRGMLDAAVGVLEHADGRTIANADQIVATVDPPEVCVDPIHLAAAIELPADPVKAQGVRALDHTIAQAVAVDASGDATRASELIAPVVPAAVALGDPGVIGRSKRILGSVMRKTGRGEAAAEVLRDAYFASRDSGDELEAASAATELAVALHERTRLDEAEDWAKLAVEDGKGVHGVANGGSRALSTLALIRLGKHDAAGAVALADRAVNVAHGADARPEVTALAARAAIRIELGDRVRALADLEAALAIARGSELDSHPAILKLRARLGFVLAQLGRTADAIATDHEVIDLGERSGLAENAAAVANAENALGVALKDAGDYPASLVALDAAVERERAVQGELGPDVGSALINRGLTLVELGRVDEAITSYRRAIAIATDPRNDDVESEAIAWEAIAEAEVRSGRLAEAERAGVTSIARWARLAADHPDSAYSHDTLGEVRLRRGDLRGARAELEHAYRLFDRDDVAASTRAHAEVRLARVLVRLGDQDRARELAGKARGRELEPADRAALDAVLPP